MGIAGDGGTVTQATSQATAVTLNKKSGLVTMHSSSSIVDSATNAFTLNNSTVGVNDIVLVKWKNNPSAASGIHMDATVTAAGVVSIQMRNVTTTTINLASAVLSFAVVNVATS